MTGAELAFVERMRPHVEAGLTIEQAGRAVLADDERLLIALHDRDTGPMIRSEITRTVYRNIRGAQTADFEASAPLTHNYARDHSRGAQGDAR